MTFRQCCAPLGVIILILAAAALTGHSAIGAKQDVGVTEITPESLVFTTVAGNVVASVGPDGALLVGTPATASTPYISKFLASRTKSAVRYVVIAPQDVAHSEGDAGFVANLIYLGDVFPGDVIRQSILHKAAHSKA